MKTSLNYDNYCGAIDVMCNYLDGAIADYENGDVENDNLIWGCINTMKLIYGLCCPLLLLGDVKEYEERMEKAINERKYRSTITSI